MTSRMTDVVLPPTFEQTASFTPGPWKYIPSHIAEGPSEVRHADGWLICCTCSDEFARLIAAAPELLAALTACQRALTIIVDPKAIKSSSAAHAYVQAVEAKSKARAAIAKANGGAQ